MIGTIRGLFSLSVPHAAGRRPTVHSGNGGAGKMARPAVCVTSMCLPLPEAKSEHLESTPRSSVKQDSMPSEFDGFRRFRRSLRKGRDEAIDCERLSPSCFNCSIPRVPAIGFACRAPCDTVSTTSDAHGIAASAKPVAILAIAQCALLPGAGHRGILTWERDTNRSRSA